MLPSVPLVRHIALPAMPFPILMAWTVSTCETFVKLPGPSPFFRSVMPSSVLCGFLAPGIDLTLLGHRCLQKSESPLHLPSKSAELVMLVPDSCLGPRAYLAP